MTKSVPELHYMLSVIVQSLVDAPDEARVIVTTQDTSVRFIIDAAPADIGKLIGKQGRTARALRQIVTSAARPLNLQVSVDIERPTDFVPPPRY